MAPRPWSGLGRSRGSGAVAGLRGREVGRYGPPPLLGFGCFLADCVGGTAGGEFEGALGDGLERDRAFGRGGVAVGQISSLSLKTLTTR